MSPTTTRDRSWDTARWLPSPSVVAGSTTTGPSLVSSTIGATVPPVGPTSDATDRETDRVKRAVEEACGRLDSVPPGMGGPYDAALSYVARRLRVIQLTVEFGPALAMPEINPADAGSVDLFWDYPNGQLLINVEADGTTSYFGTEGGARVIGGDHLDADAPREIARWIRRNAPVAR